MTTTATPQTSLTAGFFSPKNKDLNMVETLDAVTTTPIWDTVNTLSIAVPVFTPAAIRNLIFLSADRKTSKGIIKGNGLAKHIRRIGAKVLINRDGFFSWIDNQEGHAV
ncbi:MAG: hypothetical protein V4629_05495 [Pseudomonadota bacterium]